MREGSTVSDVGFTRTPVKIPEGDGLREGGSVPDFAWIHEDSCENITVGSGVAWAQSWGGGGGTKSIHS